MVERINLADLSWDCLHKVFASKCDRHQSKGNDVVNASRLAAVR